MATKKYTTAGRDLFNHRGRFGRLTRVPSSKSDSEYVNCDTFGTAMRALRADHDSNVVHLESEPVVFHEELPTGRMHLDLKEVWRNGRGNLVEIKDERFLTEKELGRQRLAKERIEERGDTHELVMRHDILKYAKSMSLQFLHRYLKLNPPSRIMEQVSDACIKERKMLRLEWIEYFGTLGLSAKVFYWAVAKGYLSIRDENGLFPNGSIQGNQ